ncbi:MAG: hypothetical protein KAY65_06615 [Planctomycetes bacterium]|nr:hypothetical protein [Planctomycetota bacterium]
MIKTLQITSILAAIVAVGLLISSVVFGVHKDDRIEAFLNSPSVLDRFAEEAKGSQAKRSTTKISPLVQQAGMFASYLAPKPKAPPIRKRVVTQVPNEGPRPEQVSAKFKLIGVSFCEFDPKMSLAFIDEPGKGLHWVRQASSVGHLVIEEVKDGLVVVRDGQRTFEMQAEEEPIAASVVGGPPRTSVVPGRPGSPRPAVGSGTRVGIAPRTGIPGRTSNGRRPPVSPRLSQTESSRMNALADRLKTLQGASRAGSRASKESEEGAKAIEMMKKLLSDAQRVSPEEAANLDNLGKNLKGTRADPNGSSESGAKIQSPRSRSGGR